MKKITNLAELVNLAITFNAPIRVHYATSNTEGIVYPRSESELEELNMGYKINDGVLSFVYENVQYLIPSLVGAKEVLEAQGFEVMDISVPFNFFNTPVDEKRHWDELLEMKKAKAFLFSYGGNNNVGRVLPIQEEGYNVDFPTENEECYGLAFRRDVDIYFEDNAREVTIEFSTKKPFKAVLEFKTEHSGGAPEEAFELEAKEGINSFNFPVPALSSKVKEIVFAIFKIDNPDLQTKVKVFDLSVK